MAMDQLVTLASFISLVRDSAQRPSPARPTDAQITTLINLRLKRLYGRLVTKYEKYFLTTSPNLTLVPGTDNLDLSAVITAGAGGASDFWKLRGVDAWDGSNWHPLRAFEDRKHNQTDPAYFAPMRYGLEGNLLKIQPIPPPVNTLRIRYTPRLLPLVNPGDSVDTWNGWEEVVALDCAIQIRMRDEEDVSQLMAERERLAGELEAEMVNRDEFEPIRQADVRGWGYD